MGYLPMGKVNILFLYSSKGYGGMVNNISLIINNLPPDRFAISVVSLTNANDPAADITINGGRQVHYRRIDENRLLDLGALRAIAAFCGEHAIDVVSCHGYKADIYGWMLRAFFGVKARFIAMAHGWVTPGSKLQFYYFLDKLALRSFDKIILVSEGLRRDLSGYLIPASKVIVVPNGIDPASMHLLGRKEARAALGVSEMCPVIGFVGRLSREKDLWTTVRAMKDILKKVPETKLVIIGDGPERDGLADLAKCCDVAGHIVLAGYRPDARSLYAAFDLYVSMSLWEGLPNSLLEAQSAGIPCIVSDIRGNNDIIRDGANGWLVRPGDGSALARKAVEVLTDPDDARRCSRVAVATIREKFSLGKRMGRLEEIYAVSER